MKKLFVLFLVVFLFIGCSRQQEEVGSQVHQENEGAETKETNICSDLVDRILELRTEDYPGESLEELFNYAPRLSQILKDEILQHENCPSSLIKKAVLDGELGWSVLGRDDLTIQMKMNLGAGLAVA